MGFNAIGYRAWEATPSSVMPRSCVIAVTGVRRTAKSKWLQRILFLSLLPTFVFAVPFFLLEQGLRNPREAAQIARLLGEMPATHQIHVGVAANLEEATPEQIAELRHYVWSNLLLTLFRYPQAVLMVLAMGIAAPPLVAHDMRSRASLIYFSRPIARIVYLLGKLGTLVFFLAMITTLPALLLYVTGVMLSPNLSVVAETWDLPVRILVASMTLILPTASIALLFSSLTTESRYAAFAWYAFWILGHVGYGVLTLQLVREPQTALPPGWRTFVSPYRVLGTAQSWIFDLASDTELVMPVIVALALATVVSLGVVIYRISLPLRA